MTKQTAGAAALHAQVGSTHAVGVLALRVLLVEDTSGWFAQGLDIDYAACGSSVEEVKKAFEVGFCSTVHEHLIMHGTIERLLKPAQQEAWKEFYESPKAAQSYSCIQLHSTTQEEQLRLAENFPFDSIVFLEKAQPRAKARVGLGA